MLLDSLEAELSDGLDSSAHWTPVDEGSTKKHGQGVKKIKDILGGGMNRHHNSGPVLSQMANKRHHFVGCVGVQARGGLIEEQDARVGDEGDADVGALGLASRDALGQSIADLHTTAALQGKLLEDDVYSSLLALPTLTHGSLEHGSIHEHLLHCQDTDESVKLLHIASVLWARIKGLSITCSLHIAMRELTFRRRACCPKREAPPRSHQRSSCQP
jgi:hypothetical protein